MRMLPDNPSLDFLRREAKDLLGALRETDPSASLADAQRALAELYGQRSWTDLRVEVERRRAAVPAPDPAVATELAAAFGLGAPRAPMVPIAYQHMGRTWSLETDRGRWQATPVFDWIGDPQAAVGVDLQERARTVGVVSPRPVRDPDGHLVRRVAEQNWRIDEWQDLGPTPIRPVRSTVARRVGEILGAIHGLGLTTDAAITPYLTARRPSDDWRVLVERARAAGRPWSEELNAQLPRVEALRAIAADEPAGPRIVSVCDLVPEGVRYASGDDLAVVHWDFAGAHVAEWELGYVLMQWAVYGEANTVAGRGVLDGYRDRVGSTPSLSLGSFTVGISGYLNWVFNAFCEAIDPESDEKGEFADRAARDVLVDPLTTDKLASFLAELQPVRG